MIRKCGWCQGRGGVYHGTVFFPIFLQCPQCKGKGKWYPGVRPKRNTKR